MPDSTGTQFRKDFQECSAGGVRLRRMSHRLQDLGLLVARVGVGLGFAWFHGLPKLRGGPAEWEEVGSALGVFGLEYGARAFGFAAALSECLGGMLVAAGLGFRPAALAIAVVMTVASSYHLGTGEGSPAHALKYAFLFFGFVLIGPGRFAIDHVLGKRICGRGTSEVPAPADVVRDS